MKIVPIILFKLIGSLNKKNENDSVKRIETLLNKYALFKGMNDRIFCHKIAYMPRERRTPKK